MALQPSSITDFDDGRYQVLRELGRGGMGVVYACTDTQLSRRVAIKTLPDELRSSQRVLDAFLQEARALAALDHPNLVRIFDARQEQNGKKRIAYLVMEFVEGTTLEHMIYDGPAPAEGEPSIAPGILPTRLLLCAQVADALAYCHQRGIIHRDIKPANILVTREGQVKLVDFGLARSLELLMQKTTRVRGTPAYMAPEQITGAPLGPYTDLYAFGVSVYESVCGRTPFIEGEMIYHQVHTPPPRPISLEHWLPPLLDELIMSCLAKDPLSRPQSAEALAGALRALAGDLRRSGLLSGNGMSGAEAAPSGSFGGVSGTGGMARVGGLAGGGGVPGEKGPSRPMFVSGRSYLVAILLGVILASAVLVIAIGTWHGPRGEPQPPASAIRAPANPGPNATHEGDRPQPPPSTLLGGTPAGKIPSGAGLSSVTSLPGVAAGSTPRGASHKPKSFPSRHPGQGPPAPTDSALPQDRVSAVPREQPVERAVTNGEAPSHTAVPPSTPAPIQPMAAPKPEQPVAKPSPTQAKPAQPEPGQPIPAQPTRKPEVPVLSF